MSNKQYKEYLKKVKRIEEIVDQHSDLKHCYMIHKTHTRFDVNNYDESFLITDIGETFISKSGLVTCKVAYYDSSTELIPYNTLKTEYIRFNNIDGDKDKGLEYRYYLIHLSWDLSYYRRECNELLQQNQQENQINAYIDYSDEELCNLYKKIREPYLKIRARYSDKIERYNQIIAEIHKASKGTP